VGTTEDQLRREAEMQRSRMGDTLDAIGDRLSPERMVERRKAAVGQKVRGFREAVMGSPGYQEPMSARLRSQAGGAMQSASDTMHTATDRVQNAPHALAEQAQGNPVAAGLIAFGAGVLLATVFPASRTEQRILDDARPQLQGAVDELKTAGREVAEGAKDHAREAVEEVKSAGSQATSQVRDQATQSAQQVKGDATR
jgi:ElaB/YqjD/DUF883 family membrane-anchored ribosome-binding protein